MPAFQQTDVVPQMRVDEAKPFAIRQSQLSSAAGVLLTVKFADLGQSFTRPSIPNPLA